MIPWCSFLRHSRKCKETSNYKIQSSCVDTSPVHIHCGVPDNEQIPVIPECVISRSEKGPVRSSCVDARNEKRPVRSSCVGSRNEKRPVRSSCVDARNKKRPVRSSCVDARNKKRPVRSSCVGSRNKIREPKKVKFNIKRRYICTPETCRTKAIRRPAGCGSRTAWQRVPIEGGQRTQ